MRFPYLPLVAFTLITVAGDAFAAPPDGSPRSQTEQVTRLISEGQQFRKQGRDDEALAKFQAAQAIAPSAQILAQIALAEQALGHFVVAEQHIDTALLASEPWIERHRKTLVEARRQIAEHLGSLELRTNVPAAIDVDGERRGTTPLAQPLRVPVGSHVVRFTAEGYEAISRTISVDATGLARETVTLTAIAAPTAAVAPPGDAQQPTPAPAISKGNGAHTVGWVLVGGAVVAGAVAGAGYGLGEHYAVALSSCAKDPNGGDCKSERSSAIMWRTAGLGASIASGVLLVGGASLLLFTPAHTQGDVASRSFSCAPSFSGKATTLDCAGTF